MKNNNHYSVFVSKQLVQNQRSAKCSRCNGSGYLPQYAHVERGICFKCRGVRGDKFVYKN